MVTRQTEVNEPLPAEVSDWLAYAGQSVEEKLMATLQRCGE
jgi:hypothetical protein